MGIKFVKENQSKGMRIPSAALKICGLQNAAGIPADAHLWACPDLDAKTIHIVEAPEVDLHAVHPDLLEKRTEDGICLGELQKYLTSEEVVYGG